MTDSAWGRVATLPLTLYLPTFRGTPTERSEVRLAYDAEYLYAGGWFYDSRPDQIQINSLYRDRWSGDDAFALYLDPFNDNETGLWFLTTPAGIRIDQSISGDGASFNDSWNAPWDVATQVTDQGWFVEIRIPLATLGFQVNDERVVMGLTVTRLIPRKNERVTFPAIDPRHEFRRPSMMQDVELRGVAARRPVFVTPYVLSGADRRTALPPGSNSYQSTGAFVFEAGGDLRYGVSDNFHLDLTVNTDFAQVEADDQQVNLTRFPLFFPEKRQFFQERAGVFEFDLASGGRLFHSRRIGLAPDRTPIRMLAGARVVARSGGWDVATLDVQTDERGDIPGENLGVARVRRQLFNPFSYVGGMVTSRITEDGGYNVATGLDGSVRVFGDDYLTVRGAATFDDRVPNGNFADRSQLYLQWRRALSRGLSYTLQLHRVGEFYRPELGFLPRQNFTRAGLFSEYYFTANSSWLERHGPGAIGYFYFGNDNQELETYYLAYWWNYVLKSGSRGWFEVIHNYENVPADFSLGEGAEVIAGEHQFTEAWFNYQPSAGRKLRTGIDARAGGFYDGWRWRIKLDPVWNLSRHLELGGSYEFNQIRFPGRTGLDAHVGQLRVGAAANSRLSATALVQVNSVDDRLGANLRLRYNFGEGSDLWLVYDEGFNTDREPELGMPRLPWSDIRVVRLKLTHTFVPW